MPQLVTVAGYFDYQGGQSIPEKKCARNSAPGNSAFNTALNSTKDILVDGTRRET
jgi:hypothetical protein